MSVGGTGSMAGRTCLVTGASSGHGRALAHGLAARGADLVLLGRSAEKCRAVQSEIAAAHGGKPPAILVCDLGSREQIDRAAAELLASGRPLHVLVNNAGLVSLRRQETADGVELTFAVNYLAAFQLTLRLLPRLLESAPARVVNVCSDTYRIASLDLDDLLLRRRYGWLRAYAHSKLAILHFTLDLARRLEGSGVSVNAVDPGPVASNIGANNPGIAYRLVAPVIRHLFPSPQRAARTALWLATAPELEGASGGYYRSLARRERPLPWSPEQSAQLWRASAELSGAEFAGDPSQRRGG
jgi:NAD(P)-dependent dehydrogenase (short-subunit alcohol dehydrogenase family)